jgi:hypothetical protein
MAQGPGVGAGGAGSGGAATGLARMMSPRRVVMSLIALCALWLVLVPPSGMAPEMALGAGLILVTIGMLATGVLAEQLVVLIFFLFAMILVIAPPSVVFSGFTSGAFWLVFGGLVIGGGSHGAWRQDRRGHYPSGRRGLSGRHRGDHPGEHGPGVPDALDPEPGGDADSRGARPGWAARLSAWR